MSQRETRIKPLSLLVLGGINQRVRDTELNPQEWSLQEGLFPEFAGLQSRIWGKRLLEKYDNALYGIFQFWSPMGYGAGLYQFDGILDYGVWLTSTSRFDFTLDNMWWDGDLGFELGYDGGGMTLDEFGNPYGYNFGYGVENSSPIIFSGGSGAGTSRLGSSQLSNVGTPDDRNGGPAGQGRRCKWGFTEPVEEIVPIPGDIVFGSWDDDSEQFTSPLPYPIDPTIVPQKPTEYITGGGPYGDIWFASVSTASAKIDLGFGNWKEFQEALSQNTKGLMDFSAYFDEDSIPEKIEFKIRHNGNMPFDYEWIVASLQLDDVSAVPIDVWDYIQQDYRTDPNPVGGGFIVSDFVVIEAVRFSYRRRICA